MTVDQSERHLTILAHRAVQTAGTMRGEDAVKAPLFGELGSTLYLVSAQFDPIFAAEQALLTKRTANARTASHRSAMVMGIGGGIIFIWLLLVGGYAGLTSNRLKQTAVDRKKADERFRALLESAPDAMVIVGEDGRIALVNAQTEKLFGYARAELLGNTVEMLVPARFRDKHPQHRNRLLRRPQGACDGLRPGALRFAQGRHRVSHRDQPEPARDRGRHRWSPARSATSPSANTPRRKSRSSTTLPRRCWESSDYAMVLMLDPEGRIVSWTMRRPKSHRLRRAPRLLGSTCSSCLCRRRSRGEHPRIASRILRRDPRCADGRRLNGWRCARTAREFPDRDQPAVHRDR